MVHFVRRSLLCIQQISTRRSPPFRIENYRYHSANSIITLQQMTIYGKI